MRLNDLFFCLQPTILAEARAVGSLCHSSNVLRGQNGKDLEYLASRFRSMQSKEKTIHFCLANEGALAGEGGIGERVERKLQGMRADSLREET